MCVHARIEFSGERMDYNSFSKMKIFNLGGYANFTWVYSLDFCFFLDYFFF